MEQRTTSANPWMSTTVDQTAARAEDDVGEDGGDLGGSRATTATQYPIPFVLERS